MQLVTPAHACSASARLTVRALLRRALEDTGVSERELAAKLERPHSKVNAWVRTLLPSESDARVPQAPLYLLAHPGVPVSLHLRLLGDLLALARRTCPPRTRETAAALLLSVAGEAVQGLADALTDGVVSDSETRALRLVVARLRDRCTQWLEGEEGER